MLKQTATKTLIDTATAFIGVTEEGADNCGKQVEIFQRAVNSKAERESWCMAFIQYCLIKALEKLTLLPEFKNKVIDIVFKSEHVLTVWNKTDKKYRLTKPEIGCVVFWQFVKDGVETASGHTGLVVGISVDGKSITTIEGNTGPGGAVVRNGDGVYKKVRMVAGTKTMKVVGFIYPFDIQE